MQPTWSIHWNYNLPLWKIFARTTHHTYSSQQSQQHYFNYLQCRLVQLHQSNMAAHTWNFIKNKPLTTLLRRVEHIILQYRIILKSWIEIQHTHTTCHIRVKTQQKSSSTYTDHSWNTVPYQYTQPNLFLPLNITHFIVLVQQLTSRSFICKIHMFHSFWCNNKNIQTTCLRTSCLTSRLKGNKAKHNWNQAFIIH